MKEPRSIVMPRDTICAISHALSMYATKLRRADRIQRAEEIERHHDTMLLAMLQMEEHPTRPAPDIAGQEVAS